MLQSLSLAQIAYTAAAASLPPTATNHVIPAVLKARCSGGPAVMEQGVGDWGSCPAQGTKGGGTKEEREKK